MKQVTLTLLFYVVCASLVAGNAPEAQPSLDEQFMTIKENTTVIEQFRMVKAFQVEQFWRAVKDTLKQKNEAIAAVRQQMASVDAGMAQLKQALEAKDQEIQSLDFAASNIQLLGMDVRKESFLLIAGVSALILIFLTGAAFAAFRYSLEKARESQLLYDEITREYETYKHRMVEKEVKILRELQDYRNRFVELKRA